MLIDVNGIALYYEKTGSGTPLLLLHGNGEDHTIFNEAIHALESGFTCYALDTRGHGQSSKVDVLHYDDMASDVIAFMEAEDLRGAVVFGFSDGGITGLLATARSDRIAKLIVSGANLTPAGVKAPLRAILRVISFFSRDPKIALMLNEPHISDDTLASIRAETLVLAGSRDLILEKETRHIAAGIPGASLRILRGETHGSHIVHSTKIADIIKEFT